ncbi:hypothetical protein L226DRAFT_141246 [Lentinus tigrinus ALCF2SS1-7]|nr:hypothetical protein L226DRAFT_141246 [Lentinus tigrinus ALCF2SS1-7]
MKRFPSITSSRNPAPHEGVGKDTGFASSLCSYLSVAKHGSPSLDSNALHLPYLVVDHKLDDQNLMGTAERQRRMNSVSAAAFLRAIGITDFNVYGVAQSGPYYTVSATWYSSEDKVYYTCDQGVPRFDFHKFEDVIRFAAFTLELKEHARTLKERYDAAKEAFFTRVKEEFERCGGELPGLDSDLWWTATLQADRYGLPRVPKGPAPIAGAH